MNAIKSLKVLFAAIFLVSLFPEALIGRDPVEIVTRGQIQYQIYRRYTSPVYVYEVSVHKVDKNTVGELIIPNTINYRGEYYSVIEIDPEAFMDCLWLTSITIPNSVATIGKRAFQYCSNLTSINIPESLRTIEENTFFGCSGLMSINIPNSVTTIYESAFSACRSLKKLTIEDGYDPLLFRDYYQFKDCPIEELYIGRTLNWGRSPFKDNKALYSVIIGNSVTEIASSSFEGCSNLSSVTLSESVVKIGSFAFGDCSSLTSITIPNSVTTIGGRAFRASGLNHVTIPNTVAEIGCSAFSYCTDLKLLTIEDSSEPLLLNYDISNYDAPRESDYHFFSFSPIETLYLGRNYEGQYGRIHYAENTFPETLTSVTIGNCVTEIGQFAFHGCKNLSRLTIEDGNEPLSLGLETSAAKPFKDSPLESLYLGRTLSNEYPSFNSQENLKRVTIGEFVSTIGSEAFKGCIELETVSIGNSVKEIGKEAFYNCSALKNLTFGNSITEIGSYSFCGCSTLTSLDLPESVIAIGQSAFEDCINLSALRIPNSVEKIEYWAFKNCIGVKELSIEDGRTPLLLDFNFSNSIFCDCPIEKLYLGRTVPRVNAFKNIETLTTATLGNYVTEIGESAFEGCYRLKSINIPNSVTSIGDNAFSDCSELSTIVIPGMVESIGRCAFYNCSGLKQLTMEDGSTPIKIGCAASSFVFCNCPIETLYLGRDMPYDGDYPPFYGVKTLNAIAIGTTVTIIGKHAFEGCERLKSISIPGSVKTIGYWAFKDCTNLKEVTIEDSEETLAFEEPGNGSGCAVFYKCPAETLYLGRNLSYTAGSPISVETLSSVTISNFVTEIGSLAFYNSDKITSIVIPKSVTSIGWRAFSGCELSTVEVENPVPPTLVDDVFNFNTLQNAVLTVPEGCSGTYRRADGWKEFFTIVGENEIPAASIELNLKEMTLAEGSSQTLVATVSPDDTTDPTISWVSSNPEVATVNKQGVFGVVTAIKPGNVTITATTVNGMSATCNVTVTKKSSGNIDVVNGDNEDVYVDGNSIIVPSGSKVYDITGVQVNPDGVSNGIYIVHVPGAKTLKIRVF